MLETKMPLMSVGPPFGVAVAPDSKTAAAPTHAEPPGIIRPIVLAPLVNTELKISRPALKALRWKTPFRAICEAWGKRSKPL